MKYKKINGSWVIVLKKNEKIIKSLKEFVKERNIKSGYFNAIGAVSSVELAHYNLEKKKYTAKPINQPLEIVSLMGNITMKGNKRIIHGHIVVGTDKMKLYGGHLKEATVAATCEIIFNEFEEIVEKKYDENSGLNLMKVKPNLRKGSRTFKAKIFSEIVNINGKKYEHFGCKDEKGKLGDFFAENVGKRVEIIFKFIDNKKR